MTEKLALSDRAYAAWKLFTHKDESKAIAFADRSYAAWKALRGQEMHFNPYGFNGGFNYGGTFFTAGGPTYGGPGWTGNRMAGTDINYLREVGDLTQASLPMAAIQWVGRNLPNATLEVVKYDDDGDWTAERGHDLSSVWKRPNKYYSNKVMCKAIAMSWILNGNVYILKIRNRRGQVVELWWLPHWTVRPRWNPTDDTSYIDWYDYHVGQNTYKLPVEDVIHLRDGIDPHYDRCGMSPLLALLREIYSDIEVTNYCASLSRNGAIPPYILTPKSGASEVEVKPEKIKEGMIRATIGDNRGKVVYVPAGLELIRLGIEPDKMDLTALHRMPEERLAAVIGLPAVVLGFGSIQNQPTYSNAEAADKRAYQSYMQPLWSYIAEELEHQLLRNPNDFDEQDLSIGLEFDTKKVPALQDNEDKKHARWRAALQAGGIKVRQFQEKIGVKPDDSADFYIPGKGVSPMTSDEALILAQNASETAGAVPADVIEGQDVTNQRLLPPVETAPQKRLAAMKKLTEDDLKTAEAFWQAAKLGDMSKLWGTQSNGNGVG